MPSSSRFSATRQPSISPKVSGPTPSTRRKTGLDRTGVSRVNQTPNKQAVTDLVIAPPLRKQIEAEGCAAYPNECCGMLLGRDITESGTERRIVDRLVAGSNTFAADEQYHRFSI